MFRARPLRSSPSYRYSFQTLTNVMLLTMVKIQKMLPPLPPSMLIKAFRRGRKEEARMMFATQFRASPIEDACETAWKWQWEAWGQFRAGNAMHDTCTHT
jgi:hypothetical protein